MVLLGGLELVAAGYIIHKHSKNKKEKHRLEEEAAALQRQKHSVGRRHSYDGGRPHDRKHTYDDRNRTYEDRNRAYDDRKHTYEGRKPPRELSPQYTNVKPSPSRETNNIPPQDYYPPTGWPAHWSQSQQPSPTAYVPPNYAPNRGSPTVHQHPPYSPPPFDRSQTSRPPSYANLNTQQYPPYPPPPFEQSQGEKPPLH